MTPEQVIVKETNVAQNSPKEAVEPQNCDLVSKYDWDIKTAKAICLAESGGNPLAHNRSNRNGSNDKGLMQINSIHVKSGLIGDDERFNPQSNLDAAYAIYKGSGFKAWTTYNNKAYVRYL